MIDLCLLRRIKTIFGNIGKPSTTGTTFGFATEYKPLLALMFETILVEKEIKLGGILDTHADRNNRLKFIRMKKMFLTNL